jgi:hypothetical protein
VIAYPIRAVIVANQFTLALNVTSGNTTLVRPRQKYDSMLHKCRKDRQIDAK